MSGTRRHVPLALDFVVIGAQKSASTFLQHRLAAHPDIQLPLTESPEFEDPCYSADTISALAARLAAAPRGVRRGLKRPNYLGLAEVPLRLARHAPHARLVVVLRDPVARAISAYRHYVISGLVELRSVDYAFKRLLNGDVDSRFPRAHEILDWGRYGEHLQRYQRLFLPEQLLVHLHEDLATDADKVVSATFDFLGVNSTSALLEDRRPRNVGPQSTLHLRLGRTRSRSRRAYLARLTAGDRAAARLRWPLMAALTGIDRCVLPHLPGRLDEPSPTLLETLRDYYRTDVRHTQELIRRDLTPWT